MSFSKGLSNGSTLISRYDTWATNITLLTKRINHHELLLFQYNNSVSDTVSPTFFISRHLPIRTSLRPSAYHTAFHLPLSSIKGRAAGAACTKGAVLGLLVVKTTGAAGAMGA